MKMLSNALLVLLLCLTTAVSYAQPKPDTRPKLFASLPETIAVNKNALKSVFTFFPGQKVTINLANNLAVTGEVLSNEVKYSNLQNVIIKASNLNNALVSISKIINADKSISYAGRIISTKAYDGYAIKQNLGGDYSLEKFETANIFQDCSF
jgi:hypothetical protein